MTLRTVIFFCALFAGSLAFPTPKEDGDLTAFFDATSSGGQGRIVGGTVAPIGAHPWLVAMTHGRWITTNLVCGGSLLNRRTVLTAAHCIWTLRNGPTLRSDVRLVAGTNRFASDGQRLAVRGFSVHPDYEHSHLRNDIATVFAAGLFELNDVVQLVALDWSVVDAGVRCRAAGWGSTRNLGGRSSAQLMQVDLPTITNEQCNEQLRSANSRRFADTITEMCAFYQRGRGVCSGDSGSPLMRLDRNQQVGIVSWTLRQCADGGPDVYVRVSGFRSWILHNTQPE